MKWTRLFSFYFRKIRKEEYITLNNKYMLVYKNGSSVPAFTPSNWLGLFEHQRLASYYQPRLSTNSSVFSVYDDTFKLS